MEYTQIDRVAQLGAVRNRIREIENIHMLLSLRISTPDINQPITEMDRQNLYVLEGSLQRLHEMEKELSGESGAGSSS